MVSSVPCNFDIAFVREIRDNAALPVPTYINPKNITAQGVSIISVDFFLKMVTAVTKLDDKLSQDLHFSFAVIMDRPRRSTRQPAKAPTLVATAVSQRAPKRKAPAEVDPQKQLHTLLHSSKSDLASLDMTVRVAPDWSL